jgi:hypothetical protein
MIKIMGRIKFRFFAGPLACLLFLGGFPPVGAFEFAGRLFMGHLLLMPTDKNSLPSLRAAALPLGGEAISRWWLGLLRAKNKSALAMTVYGSKKKVRLSRL